MAMFDDPRRNLQWLAEELRVDQEGDDPMALPEEDPDFWHTETGEEELSQVDLDQLLTQARALSRPAESQPRRQTGRKPPVQSGRKPPAQPKKPAHLTQAQKRAQAPDFSRAVYQGQQPEELAAVYDEAPPPKGIGGLVVLAALEVAGIVAIALWWAQWL